MLPRLPFHRREGPDEGHGAAPARDSLFKQLAWFVIDWIKVSWKDLLTLAVLGAAALAVSSSLPSPDPTRNSRFPFWQFPTKGTYTILPFQIYSAPVAAVRNFPITFDTSGDIVYPELAYPGRGWIISPALSGVLSAAVPACVMVAAQLRIRSFGDCSSGVLGLLQALLVLGALAQAVLKQVVGGFRPTFLDVYMPAGRGAGGRRATRRGSTASPSAPPWPSCRTARATPPSGTGGTTTSR